MRNDIHAPASQDFDPQKYEFVDVFYSPGLIQDTEMTSALVELQEQGYVIGNGSAQSCGHCGSRLRYSAILKHKEVKEYIHIGERCLSNRFFENGYYELDFSMTQRKFQELRRNARLNRQRLSKEESKQSLLAKHPSLVVLDATPLPEYLSNFTRSIAHQLQRNGILTPSQIEHAEKALETEAQDFAQQQEIQRKEEEEWAARVNAPIGRQMVEAAVVSTRIQEGREWYEQDTLKMLVEGKGGWRAWATIPSSLRSETLAEGQTVEFTATFEPKASDPKFAYAKRPAGQARLI